MKQALRIFPTLTILNNDLVKTVDYKNPRYLGDPINAIKLFNNKNVDEIAILDISSRFNKNSNEINYDLLQEMAQEAFVPLSYGGNIKSAIVADKIINIGFEKVLINSLLFENHTEVKKIVSKLGSQSVVIKIDYTIQNGLFSVFYNEGKSYKLLFIDELIKLIEYSQY
jgi:cyclase